MAFGLWKLKRSGRSHSVAPTQQVPVVRVTVGQREGLMLRWGLVPPDDLMHAQKVSTRVNLPKKNEEILLSIGASIGARS
jgi:hypothetical protein